MSSTEQSSSKGNGNTWLMIAIGVIIAIVGFGLSVNQKELSFLAFQESLAHQGIPLDLGKTISTIGMFIALFPALKVFYFSPLAEAIHIRTSDLERTFSEAEDLRAEMTKMRSEYEQRIAATEAEARERIQAEIKNAQALRQRLQAEATEQHAEMLRKAEQEIAAERDKVLTELRLNVVNLTLGATERLLGENMDTDKNRRLVEEFINKVEVAS